MYILNKYTEPSELPSFLEACKSGKSIGLLSEAGCPGVADPGAEVVKIAHKQNIQVIPLVGPSSILLAMMSSGMNGQNFAFNGYLPIDKKQRAQSLLKYQRIAIKEDQAQIFIETPYRSEALFTEILKVLDSNTKLCVACDLSLDSEYIKTYTVLEWKKNKPLLEKRPCIFIIEGSF